MQLIPSRALVVLPLLALAACASAPALETSLSGTVPAGRTYALVDGTKYFGSADLPAEALTQCLAKAGLTPGARPDTFVQIAHMARPANSRLLPPGAEPAGKARHLHAKDNRDELVLAITDSATGTLLTRASAAATMRPGAASAPDLAQAVCGLITSAGPSLGANAR